MFNNERENSLLDNIFLDLMQNCDPRGSLTVVQHEDFCFERVFWIYNVPQGSERGGHAHRSCAELLIALHGSFDLDLHDGKQSITVHLDNPSRGVIIRPMVWCRLYNFSPDFVGLCLASQPYKPEGYINSFEEFCRS